MAFMTILFMFSMAAIVNAAFPGFDDDDFPSFGPPLMFPSLPSVTNMLNNIPKIPRNPSVFRPGASAFAIASMPPMPSIPLPTFPSVEEIASGKDKAGGTLNGIIVASESVGTRDENGDIQRTGGSTVLLNNNGDVTVQKFGDSPPELVIHTGPAFPEFPGHKFNKPFKPIKPFKPFKPFKPSFEPFEFKKIDPDFMNYVPKEGENYHAVSSSSHSFSKNINGKKESGGSVSAMENDNGKVAEDKLAFHRKD